MGAKTDQILAAAQSQGFPHQIVVAGALVLQQGALHGLFVGICGNIYLVHSPGIKTCVIHHSGQRGGSGIEVLYLLRAYAVALEI